MDNKREARLIEQNASLQKKMAAINHALKIESSLEKVRRVAMLMKKPADMLNICRAIGMQLENLGVKEIRNIQTAIFYPERNTYMNYEYYAKHDKTFITETTYNNNKIHKAFALKMQKGKGEFFITHIKGKKVKEWIAYQKTTNVFIDKYLKTASSLNYYWYSLGPVALGISTYYPLTTGEEDLFRRFMRVFELAFKRYLDIEKSEAQAKEAQIQLALERVRARTMAMQKSNELSEVVFILFRQFRELGENPDQATIGIINEKEKLIEYWVTMYGKQMDRVFKFSMNEPHVTKKIYKAWKKQEKSLVIDLRGKELYEFARYRESMGGAKYNPDEKHRIINVAFFSMGLLNVQSTEARSEESIKLLERFATVFEQTYTRFLDLQKAEAQAREAQIEAALERVRSRAMAMYKTEDINAAVVVVFQELDKLKLGTIRCGIGRLHTENWIAQLWTIGKSDKGNSVLVSGEEPMNIHPMLTGIYTSWQTKKEEFSYELVDDDLLKYYKAIGDTDFGLPENMRGIQKDQLRQYFHAAFFDAGGLFAFRESPFSVEAKNVMKRFANVFNLTYKRFLDLQQAEAQAREAQIEVALERVRSRTLAMQKSDELAETAAVLFQQLILLGIEPNRLYIGITEDNSTNVEFWITDEDGSKVSTMFKGDAAKNVSIKRMHDGWLQQEKSIVFDLHGKELADYFHYLSEELHVPFKGGLKQERRWQYIAYFSKGFIGMASPEEQPAETILLLERFAYVFNLTFTRFNDLKMAEAHALQAEQDLLEIKAARKKAEDALTELKSTQKQLIQSEKMASLGELTAGIAHEIQNPLNFVNNFSEVSNELIEEMKVELEKGNMEDAMAIAEDVRQNLEKIKHHGKRADGIVKGMLQHSRTSSGQKESTDINLLCDEYLRLAFHGLRAKEKTFNAEFKSDFDTGIGKILIVPQDMGRVLLNLINNAFYAVNEKSKTQSNTYKPEVIVSTKKIENSVFITVRDNGNGIPDAIREKIFQPFFTTKPTGQGTGLGLSLSYDIVKAHDGQIKVESKKGEGSEFIIELNISSSHPDY